MNKLFLQIQKNIFLNENTGEIIYAAIGINESGELFEIPLEEYLLEV